MLFSQRIGLQPVKSVMQIEGIDDSLKNRLWNIIRDDFFDLFNDAFIGTTTERGLVCRLIWKKFFNYPIDDIPRYNDETNGAYYPAASLIIQLLKEWYYSKAAWYNVYDFIEFIATESVDYSSIEIAQIQTNFIVECNKALELEMSGYRFIDKKLAAITNTLEIEEIESSIKLTNQFTSLNGANIHLAESLSKLSDRKNPDYRNSIKESISAVENLCRKLTGESTLGKALKSLESKGIEINAQLKNAFEMHYAYTNDKNSGIRHAIIEKHQDPDFEDAKYMLVTSSAFINFLIGKCNRMGMMIN